MQVIPEEGSLRLEDRIPKHSSFDSRVRMKLKSHAFSPASVIRDREFEGDSGIFRRMSTWATRIVLPEFTSQGKEKPARPGRPDDIAKFVSDDFNPGELDIVTSAIFSTGHAKHSSNSIVPLKTSSSPLVGRGSSYGGSFSKHRRYSNRVNKISIAEEKLSVVEQKLDTLLSALVSKGVEKKSSVESNIDKKSSLDDSLDGVLPPRPPSDKKSSADPISPRNNNALEDHLENRNTKCKVSFSPKRPEVRSILKHSDSRSMSMSPRCSVGSISPPEGRSQSLLPFKESNCTMMTKGNETQSFYKRQIKDREMKLISVKTFADVVTVAKEGILARVKGEGGFERVMDMNADQHQNYDTYTNPDFKWYVLLPDTKFRIYWGLFICFILIYYSVAIPLIIAFPIHIPLGVEIIFTFLFFIDLCMQFLFAYRIITGPDAGSIETRIPWITQKYVLSWFVIDFVSTVPLDLIQPNSIYFRLMRLARLLRVPRATKNFDDIVASLSLELSHVLLFKLIMCLLLILHWIACIYWFISNEEEDDIGDFLPDIVDDKDDLLYHYGVALLWAIWATTGGGCVGKPSNAGQAFFSFFCALIGVLMYAFIVGSASAAINDLDSVGKRRRNRLQHMREYLIQRGLDKNFINEIMSYYQYCWERNLQTEEENLFEGLHSSLQRSMEIAIMENVVLQVPMFRDISRPCLERLIQNMEPRIYLPKEYVIIKDEWGQEMYFIVRGKFEVLVDLNGPPLVTLTNGQSFGEMALLQKKRRNSSVRSVNHGELICLEMEPFIILCTY